MADHLQDQLMAYLKATLVAAGTAAGSEVFIEGVDPQPSGKTDWYEIEAGPEDAQPHTTGFPPNKLRDFVLILRCCVTRKDGTYRVGAGTLLRQAEAAVAASVNTFRAGGLASRGIHFLGTDEPEKDGASEKVTYCIPARFVARYSANANAPDTPT